MSVLEIVLLAIGLIIFIASFLIPDKKSSDASKIDGEALLAQIEEKVEESKQKIDEMTDETLSYSMEKTERAIDKLTNEKILAIGDYSDTVIDEISKDHNEVVFLSDMLNKNKKDLTTLLLKAVETSRTATESANGAYDLAENASKLADEAMEKAKKAGSAADFAEDKMISVKKKMIEGDAAEIKPDLPVEAEKSIEEEQKPEEVKKTSETKKTVKKSQKKTEAGSEAKEEKTPKAAKTSKAKSSKEDKAAKESKDETEKAVKKEKSSVAKKVSEGAQISLADLEETDSAPIRTMNETSGDAAAELFKKASGALRFDTSADGNGNNNERILAMHRLGRSNMAIARELGLGVGEVKLVIDLYQNML